MSRLHPEWSLQVLVASFFSLIKYQSARQSFIFKFAKPGSINLRISSECWHVLICQSFSYSKPANSCFEVRKPCSTLRTTELRAVSSRPLHADKSIFLGELLDLCMLTSGFAVSINLFNLWRNRFSIRIPVTTIRHSPSSRSGLAARIQTEPHEKCFRPRLNRAGLPLD